MFIHLRIYLSKLYKKAGLNPFSSTALTWRRKHQDYLHVLTYMQDEEILYKVLTQRDEMMHLALIDRMQSKSKITNGKDPQTLYNLQNFQLPM